MVPTVDVLGVGAVVQECVAPRHHLGGFALVFGGCFRGFVVGWQKLLHAFAHWPHHAHGRGHQELDFVGRVRHRGAT